MKAFTLDSFESPPALRGDLPEPGPAANEIVVRVHASSVNPVDVLIGMGALAEMFENEFPVVLGRDFAGVVEQVGDGVSRYRVGDEVFGFVPHANPTVHAGSWAELIVLPEDNYVAAKPEGVDATAAGAAPVAALTAIAAFDALAPAAGEDVLVIGATGGVGSFFVQLAASVGANVIAPALPEDESYLRDLGVSEILDRNADLAAAVREAHPDGVDALFDVVSQSTRCLAPQGGRPARLSARSRRRGRGTVQRHGRVVAGESPAARRAPGGRHAPRPHPAEPTRSSRPARPSRRSRRPTPRASSASRSPSSNAPRTKGSTQPVEAWDSPFSFQSSGRGQLTPQRSRLATRATAARLRGS